MLIFMALQKKMKDLDEVQVTNNQTNVTNNSVFVGSTTELQKMIKQGIQKYFYLRSRRARKKKYFNLQGEHHCFDAVHAIIYE